MVKPPLRVTTSPSWVKTLCSFLPLLLLLRHSRPRPRHQFQNPSTARPKIVEDGLGRIWSLDGGWELKSLRGVQVLCSLGLYLGRWVVEQSIFQAYAFKLLEHNHVLATTFSNISIILMRIYDFIPHVESTKISYSFPTLSLSQFIVFFGFNFCTYFGLELGWVICIYSWYFYYLYK